MLLQKLANAFRAADYVCSTTPNTDVVKCRKKAHGSGALNETFRWNADEFIIAPCTKAACKVRTQNHVEIMAHDITFAGAEIGKKTLFTTVTYAKSTKPNEQLCVTITPRRGKSPLLIEMEVCFVASSHRE